MANHDETAEGMVTVIQRFAVFDGHNNAHSAIIVVLSHGALDNIYGCPKLIGRPKLFFFNTCGGPNEEYGAYTGSRTLAKPATGQSSDSADSTVGQHTSISSDFLVARSSWPNFVSWRDERIGSWFIQALVTVFALKGSEEHVLELMTRGMVTVIQRFAGFDGHNNAHSAIVVILSHGDLDNIYGTDDQAVTSITKSIDFESLRRARTQSFSRPT
ncbi:hypothetical protein niasHS_007979 [Heterodera schachtii]|uniref:Uncharacterized protein n=1 Tax=Heterodera schachtii TaxID=97005 RepID=A0ABD2JQE1_HETSC